MKRFLLWMTFVGISLSFIAQAYALPVMTMGDNKLLYQNYETVFNADGTEKDFTNPANYQFGIGDIFVGIVDFQSIGPNSGQPTFMTGVDGYVSGIFAQQVADIYTDISTGQTVIALKAATRTTFTTLQGNTFDTGLAGDEMFKFYFDEDMDTYWEGSGNLATDIANSTDGDFWMSLGYDTGSGTTQSGDETGYSYTETIHLGDPAANFTAQSFSGLNVINHAMGSGTVFPGANDPNESRSISWLGPNFLTDAYMTSNIQGNDAYVNGGGYSATPWVFQSNDPGHINVVPEPASMLLLGLGLLVFAGLFRNKRNSIA